MGRVARNKKGRWWTTVVARKPPPSGGGGDVAADAGHTAPPASVFGAVWGPGEKSQKSDEGGTLK